MVRLCVLCALFCTFSAIAGDPWSDQLERVGCVLWDADEAFYDDVQSQQPQTLAFAESTQAGTKLQTATFQNDLCDQAEVQTAQANNLDLDYYEETKTMKQTGGVAAMERRMSCLERAFFPKQP